jgi:tetratricopeptide (TPR) repeat protein
MEPPRRPAARIERPDFALPISIEGAELQESVIASEVPAEHALTVLRAYRIVLAWAQGEEAAVRPADVEEPARWEEEALDRMDEAPDLWAPVAVIADELANLSGADPEHLARACLAISEWAFASEAPASALLFAEAAALVRPEDARRAYLVGRMLQQRGRAREAERWLRRAVRVAAASGDKEAGSLAVGALDGLSGRSDG